MESPDRGKSAVADGLVGLVGRANVVLPEDDQEPYVVDWRGPTGPGRAPWSGRPPPPRSRPSSGCAGSAASPIVPQGGNTGMCGGGDAQHRAQVVLALDADEPRSARSTRSTTR